MNTRRHWHMRVPEYGIEIYATREEALRAARENLTVDPDEPPEEWGDEESLHLHGLGCDIWVEACDGTDCPEEHEEPEAEEEG